MDEETKTYEVYAESITTYSITVQATSIVDAETQALGVNLPDWNQLEPDFYIRQVDCID